MSENSWAAVVYRSLEKRSVGPVAALLTGAALDGVEALRFAALPVGQLTWVSLLPFDGADAMDLLVERAPRVVAALARTLKLECWLLASSDYSGQQWWSFAAGGRRRWASTGASVRARARLERELSFALSDFVHPVGGRPRRVRWQKTVRLPRAPAVTTTDGYTDEYLATLRPMQMLGLPHQAMRRALDLMNAREAR